MPLVVAADRSGGAALRRRLGGSARDPRPRPRGAASPGVQRPRLARDAGAERRRALRPARDPREQPRSCAGVIGPIRLRRELRWAWLLEGAARWFSGQTEHARPAIARRLHEGGGVGRVFHPACATPPCSGGTVIDLLARRRERRAAAQFAARLHPPRPPGRSLTGVRRPPAGPTEGAWRSHLPGSPPRRAASHDRARRLAEAPGVRPSRQPHHQRADRQRRHQPGQQPRRARPARAGERARAEISSACEQHLAGGVDPGQGTRMSRGPAARKSGTSKPALRRSRLGTPSSSSMRLDELGLGLVLGAGDADELALGELRLDLACPAMALGHLGSGSVPAWATSGNAQPGRSARAARSASRSRGRPARQPGSARRASAHRPPPARRRRPCRRGSRTP